MLMTLKNLETLPASFRFISGVKVQRFYRKRKKMLNQVTKNSKTCFYNRPFDKGRLKALISWSIIALGEKKTIDLVERLKSIGYAYATKAGISLSIEDLKIPPSKRYYIQTADQILESSNADLKKGRLTSIEYFAKVIETWNKTSENLKEEVIKNFKTTDELNPVFIMAFSGARGNISQVRQLTSMRGLMSDPQGNIVNFPIQSNFREGLTLTEYIISCYGARKGVIDTALKTATSGYLTRRLVDVAHPILTAGFNCQTESGIILKDLKRGTKTLLPLRTRLIGRRLAEDVFNFQSDMIAVKNQEITPHLANQITKFKKSVLVRSPLTCRNQNSICRLCYGWNLANHRLILSGQAVGILAAQSIGEPGTQLTMRTFHTGGVFSAEVSDEIKSPCQGMVWFNQSIPGKLIRTVYGQIAFLTKQESQLFLIPEEDQDLTNISSNSQALKNLKKIELNLPAYTLLFVKQNQFVKKNETLGESSFFSSEDQKSESIQTIYSDVSGELRISKKIELLEPDKDGMEFIDRIPIRPLAKKQSAKKQSLKSQILDQDILDTKLQDQNILGMEPQDQDSNGIENQAFTFEQKEAIKRTRREIKKKTTIFNWRECFNIGEFWILSSQRQTFGHAQKQETFFVKPGDFVHKKAILAFEKKVKTLSSQNLFNPESFAFFPLRSGYPFDELKKNISQTKTLEPSLFDSNFSSQKAYSGSHLENKGTLTQNKSFYDFGIFDIFKTYFDFSKKQQTRFLNLGFINKNWLFRNSIWFGFSENRQIRHLNHFSNFTFAPLAKAGGNKKGKAGTSGFFLNKLKQKKRPFISIQFKETSFLTQNTFLALFPQKSDSVKSFFQSQSAGFLLNKLDDLRGIQSSQILFSPLFKTNTGGFGFQEFLYLTFESKLKTPSFVFFTTLKENKIYENSEENVQEVHKLKFQNLNFDYFDPFPRSVIFSKKNLLHVSLKQREKWNNSQRPKFSQKIYTEFQTSESSFGLKKDLKFDFFLKLIKSSKKTQNEFLPLASIALSKTGKLPKRPQVSDFSKNQQNFETRGKSFIFDFDCKNEKSFLNEIERELNSKQSLENVVHFQKRFFWFSQDRKKVSLPLNKSLFSDLESFETLQAYHSSFSSLLFKKEKLRTSFPAFLFKSFFSNSYPFFDLFFFKDSLDLSRFSSRDFEFPFFLLNFSTQEKKSFLKKTKQKTLSTKAFALNLNSLVNFVFLVYKTGNLEQKTKFDLMSQQGGLDKESNKLLSSESIDSRAFASKAKMNKIKFQKNLFCPFALFPLSVDLTQLKVKTTSKVRQKKETVKQKLLKITAEKKKVRFVKKSELLLSIRLYQIFRYYKKLDSSFLFIEDEVSLLNYLPVLNSFLKSASLFNKNWNNSQFIYSTFIPPQKKIAKNKRKSNGKEQFQQLLKSSDSVILFQKKQDSFVHINELSSLPKKQSETNLKLNSSFVNQSIKEDPFALCLTLTKKQNELGENLKRRSTPLSDLFMSCLLETKPIIENPKPSIYLSSILPQTHSYYRNFLTHSLKNQISKKIYRYFEKIKNPFEIEEKNDFSSFIQSDLFTNKIPNSLNDLKLVNQLLASNKFHFFLISLVMKTPPEFLLTSGDFITQSLLIGKEKKVFTNFKNKNRWQKKLNLTFLVKPQTHFFLKTRKEAIFNSFCYSPSVLDDQNQFRLLNYETLNQSFKLSSLFCKQDKKNSDFNKREIAQKRKNFKKQKNFTLASSSRAKEERKQKKFLKSQSNPTAFSKMDESGFLTAQPSWVFSIQTPNLYFHKHNSFQFQGNLVLNDIAFDNTISHTKFISRPFLNSLFELESSFDFWSKILKTFQFKLLKTTCFPTVHSPHTFYSLETKRFYGNPGFTSNSESKIKEKRIKGSYLEFIENLKPKQKELSRFQILWTQLSKKIVSSNTFYSLKDLKFISATLPFPDWTQKSPLLLPFILQAGYKLQEGQKPNEIKIPSVERNDKKLFIIHPSLIWKLRFEKDIKLSFLNLDDQDNFKPQLIESIGFFNKKSFRKSLNQKTFLFKKVFLFKLFMLFYFSRFNLVSGTILIKTENQLSSFSSTLLNPVSISDSESGVRNKALTFWTSLLKTKSQKKGFKSQQLSNSQVKINLRQTKQIKMEILFKNNRISLDSNKTHDFKKKNKQIINDYCRRVNFKLLNLPFFSNLGMQFSQISLTGDRSSYLNFVYKHLKEIEIHEFPLYFSSVFPKSSQRSAQGYKVKPTKKKIQRFKEKTLSQKNEVRFKTNDFYFSNLIGFSVLLKKTNPINFKKLKKIRRMPLLNDRYFHFNNNTRFQPKLFISNSMQDGKKQAGKVLSSFSYLTDFSLNTLTPKQTFEEKKNEKLSFSESTVPTQLVFKNRKSFLFSSCPTQILLSVQKSIQYRTNDFKNLKKQTHRFIDKTKIQNKGLYSNETVLSKKFEKTSSLRVKKNISYEKIESLTLQSPFKIRWTFFNSILFKKNQKNEFNANVKVSTLGGVSSKLLNSFSSSHSFITSEKKDGKGRTFKNQNQIVWNSLALHQLNFPVKTKKTLINHIESQRFAFSLPPLSSFALPSFFDANQKKIPGLFEQKGKVEIRQRGKKEQKNLNYFVSYPISNFVLDLPKPIFSTSKDKGNKKRGVNFSLKQIEKKIRKKAFLKLSKQKNYFSSNYFSSSFNKSFLHLPSFVLKEKVFLPSFDLVEGNVTKETLKNKKKQKGISKDFNPYSSSNKRKQQSQNNVWLKGKKEFQNTLQCVSSYSKVKNNYLINRLLYSLFLKTGSIDITGNPIHFILPFPKFSYSTMENPKSKFQNFKLKQIKLNLVSTLMKKNLQETQTFLNEIHSTKSLTGTLPIENKKNVSGKKTQEIKPKTLKKTSTLDQKKEKNENSFSPNNISFQTIAHPSSKQFYFFHHNQPIHLFQFQVDFKEQWAQNQSLFREDLSSRNSLTSLKNPKVRFPCEVYSTSKQLFKNLKTFSPHRFTHQENISNLKGVTWDSSSKIDPFESNFIRSMLSLLEGEVFLTKKMTSFKLVDLLFYKKTGSQIQFLTDSDTVTFQLFKKNLSSSFSSDNLKKSTDPKIEKGSSFPLKLNDVEKSFFQSPQMQNEKVCNLKATKFHFDKFLKSNPTLFKNGKQNPIPLSRFVFDFKKSKTSAFFTSTFSPNSYSSTFYKDKKDMNARINVTNEQKKKNNLIINRKSKESKTNLSWWLNEFGVDEQKMLIKYASDDWKNLLTSPELINRAKLNEAVKTLKKLKKLKRFEDENGDLRLEKAVGSKRFSELKVAFQVKNPFEQKHKDPPYELCFFPIEKTVFGKSLELRQRPFDFHFKKLLNFAKFNRLRIIPKTPLNVFLGQFVRYGDEISSEIGLNESGQILALHHDRLILRRAKPFLFPFGSFSELEDGDFVTQNAPLLNLRYKNLQTEDITQGIPKIEQLFEARGSSQDELNVRFLLARQFKEESDPARPTSVLLNKKAVRKSFEFIREYIIEGIQKVYRSQGVYIADKHIEIIVRQMTSKVRITGFPGKSGFLIGDIVSLHWAENYNLNPETNELKRVDEGGILYEPIIMGISNAALDSEGFISAASFQETVKVLAKASIFQKPDYLGGLKERVILGKLIPTGMASPSLDIFQKEKSKKLKKPSQLLISKIPKFSSPESSLKKKEIKTYFKLS